MAEKRRPKTGPGSISEWVTQQQGLHFCHCDCGQPIVIKPRHSEPTRGIPKYLRGHSIWAQGLPDQGAGESNPNWKGGRATHSAGYVMTYSPGHPFAMKMGYVLEHRLVVERHLREAQPDSPYLVEVAGQLYLRPDVSVHHVDGIKDNNQPANLLPLTPTEHQHVHNVGKKRRRRPDGKYRATRSDF